MRGTGSFVLVKYSTCAADDDDDVIFLVAVTVFRSSKAKVRVLIVQVRLNYMYHNMIDLHMYFIFFVFYLCALCHRPSLLFLSASFHLFFCPFSFSFVSEQK